ncbi:MAG: NAD(P)-binding protein [Fibrobacter sp.]|nr:NAD(P)-binding protein [Fibrobacter sp.]
MNDKIIILGAGISGLAAGYYLKRSGKSSKIFEKNHSWGGLCDNFTINNFRFDRFVHLSFTEDKAANDLFLNATPYIRHTPNPFNLYYGKWIKHPAQNNLYPLTEEEKVKILNDIKNRKEIPVDKINNYEEWLRTQYGDYFAEKFPMRYTKKYWQTEARDLGVKWVGNRMYRPSYDEVALGCRSTETPLAYYAKEMRYPEKGGFKAFFTTLAKDLDIQNRSQIMEIDYSEKVIKDEYGNMYSYDILISSIPLPELVKITKDVSDEVRLAAKMLRCTSGYQLSIGLKTKSIPPYLWFYIYDEDIPVARVYSPSLKSADNAPDNCSSLQLEIYCNENKYSKKDLIDKSLNKLVAAGVFKIEDILLTDLRFEKYANVIFNHDIYKNRKIVRDFYDNIGIYTIGRFGEWDYFWSDQSFLSGKLAAELILSEKGSNGVLNY